MSIKGAHNTHCLVVENEEDLKDIYIYISSSFEAIEGVS